MALTVCCESDLGTDVNTDIATVKCKCCYLFHHHGKDDEHLFTEGGSGSSHVVSLRGVTSGCRSWTLLVHGSDSLWEGFISCLIEPESRSQRIR